MKAYRCRPDWVALIAMVLFAGCATQPRIVRCDEDLQPINTPAAVSREPGAAAQPSPMETGIKMSQDKALAAYLSEAASWDADRAAQIRRSRRTAWWVAGAGWSCAVASAIALMVLMPLRRVDPFVIGVDNATGLVDVVPVYTGNAELPETVVRYFLDHYVTVCERFNYSTCRERLRGMRRFPRAAAQSGLV